MRKLLTLILLKKIGFAVLPPSSFWYVNRIFAAFARRPSEIARRLLSLSPVWTASDFKRHIVALRPSPVQSLMGHP
jgi:hypothetical protein